MQRGIEGCRDFSLWQHQLDSFLQFFPFQSSIARLVGGVLAHERFAFLP